jgi:exodeoxyribonuclease VII large subunit
MQPQIISVSEFIGIINETLGFAYPQVIVEGEVSGFKVNQGKFVFFDLKDENHTLGCFMMARDLALPIEDGMKIRVTGGPKVTKFSRFSLTVRAIELAGEGELRRAMELLRRKLTAEGLFDLSRKRPLPTYPRRIGLITSGTSAAYHDFIKILNARWGGVEVLLADVTVQGITAPDQIVGALGYFNQLSEPADVLVLIRGGGSLEDLQAFSTEPVARAVAASRTPIIVGVGHEVDTSLADHAADVRAATPTDAARLVVPDRSEISARIDHLAGRAEHLLTAATADRRGRIDRSLSRFEA